MNALTTHVGSLNGHLIEIVLNAPYQTIEQGGAFSRGTAVRRFCQSQSSEYCKIVGQQVWASPVKGYLLYAYIDQSLTQWGIEADDCFIYVPLDDDIYCVQVGAFGCIPGSERILSYEETLTAHSLRLHVLSGGALTDRFDNILAVSGTHKDYQFSRIGREIIRHRLFTSSHYVSAGAAAIFIAILASYLPSLFTSDRAPITEQVQEIIDPKGSDLAVSQLSYLDQILIEEIDYFLGKGLQTLNYDTQVGLTLTGEYPSSEVLQSMIDDTSAAGLRLDLGAGGWSITTYPPIQLRPAFSLGDFNANYLVVQKLQEQYDLAAAISTPATAMDRRTMTVELSGELLFKPALLQIAGELIGQAISVGALEITFDGYEYNYIRLTLNIAGRRTS